MTLFTFTFKKKKFSFFFSSLLLVHQLIILKEKLQLNTQKFNLFLKRQTEMQRRQELPTHMINPEDSSSLKGSLQSGNIVVIT